LKKRIAFFDFDGTITTKDSLLEFIKHSKGSLYFYLGFFLNTPFLVAYKLKIISNQSAKERILRFFFGGMSMEAFQAKCDRFARLVLPGLIRPKASREIQKLLSMDFAVVIVSASPENWIKKWAQINDVQLIATNLAVNKGRLTGRILGKNCHGKEKVNRIRERIDLSEADIVLAYGDTLDDKPMLSLAGHAFYKPFR
jgi:HAD superfamily hydrolase (TIGR01490 family)